MEMQTERTDLWTQLGKERVGPTERAAWKHKLPYVKQRARGNLLYDARSSNQVLCDSLEGGDGVGGGTEVQGGGDICIPMADSC